MSQASSSEFAFPTLDARDIASALLGMGIEASENDFRQPKREKWEVIFVDVLTHVTGCSQQENIFLHHLPSLSNLDYPELYENAIPLFHLTKALQRILFTCGLEDFKVLDVVEPKPKRLIKICSALVNFMRFQEDRRGFFISVKEENETLVEQRASLMKENEELSRRISSIKAAREEQQPEIARLRAELDAEMEKLQRNQEVAMEKNRQHTHLKTNISEKKAALARIHENVAVLREEGNKLSGQIVQSPDRMKGEIERMQTRLQKLEEDKGERLERLHRYKQQKSLLEKHMGDVEQALRLISSINQHIGREKEVLAEISRYKDSIQSAKYELQELDRQETHQKRILKSKQEKLTKLRLQQEAKVNGVKDAMEQLQMEKENLDSACTHEEKEVGRIREELKRLVAEGQARAKEAQTMIDQIQSKYSQLLMGVDRYHQRLGGAWDELKGQLVQHMRDVNTE